MLQVFFITILTLKNFTSLVLTSVEVLEHCHDFRAPRARVEKGDNYAQCTEKRPKPKGLKKFVRCCLFTTLTAILNKHEFVFRTFTTFTQVCRLCKKIFLAKIDTEMLIPEGRKLPLEVEKEGILTTFPEQLQTAKD